MVRDPLDRTAAVQLRLYVARSTPNSVRAEQNLAAALACLGTEAAAPQLEIIDVFSQAKRAIVDGVVVTPTLVASVPGKRIVLMGDLSDRIHLQQMLEGMAAVEAPSIP